LLWFLLSFDNKLQLIGSPSIRNVFKEFKMKKAQIMLIMIILCSVCFLPGQVVESSPRTNHLYVTPGGPASGNCTETTPCNLRYAVEVKAVSGDYIYVESGYYEDNTSGLDELLYIDKSLSIFGSCDFSGSATFLCDSRKHDSILDAGGNKRVVTIEGTGTESVFFWGFWLQNGNADNSATGACNTDFAPLEGCGGGMNVSDLNTIFLRNNVFWANTAGDATPPTSYLSLGGGLYAENIDSMRVEFNHFNYNYAAYRGIGVGGGVFLANSGTGTTELDFHNNEFVGNEISTTHDGFGGGMMSYQNTNLVLKSSVFKQNNAIEQRLIEGAGLYVDSSSFNLEHSFFTDQYGYSVLRIDGHHFWGEVVWNRFWENETARNIDIVDHGTVYIYHNFLGFRPATTRGGASTNIRIVGDGLYMLAAIIRYNSIAQAGVGVDIWQEADVIIERNIFANHYVEAINTSSAGGTSYWGVDTNMYYANTGNDVPGTNPIYDDPAFVDPDTGDFHLMSTSPAIDVIADSSPRFSTDIDNDVLPTEINSPNTPFDLGADEFTYHSLMPAIWK